MIEPPAALTGAEKAYGRRPALRGVDLALRTGEILALLGPNGAGKTTAVRLLLGLRRPDRGTARLFGLDPRRVEARRRCGATPQETDLPDTLRVHEIVDFVRAHFEHPLTTSTALDRFGLAAIADRQAGGLSGGQRRRLAIALAFAGDPEVVFLDEPSAGLDPGARRSLWESVLGFAAHGRSILLTTHDLHEAEALADRVVLLDDGRVVRDGTVAEIRARAGLTRIRLRLQPLPSIPGLARAVENGRHVTLLVRSTPDAIHALVAAGADLDDLEVGRATLEQALGEPPS
jgi:ABC-2 type transport system ATP-binding protein